MTIMLRQYTNLVLILACSLFFASCSSTKVLGLEQGWDVIGERKVNFLRDRDLMEVSSLQSYTAIRFKAEGQDIRINEMKIVFATGDKLEPAVDEVIKAGEWSRVIELGREGRQITGIEFKYRSMGSVLSGRAELIVIARRYDPYRTGY